MPLPVLPLRSPETTTYRTGSGFTDFNVLLREVHEGVLELGVGQCEVRCKDDPVRRKLGFELYTQKDGVARWWEFEIGLSAFKATTEPHRSKMASVAGRAEIAAWLEQGRTPEEIAALASPSV